MIPRPAVVTGAAALLAGSVLAGAGPVAASPAGDPARTTTPGVYVVTLATPPAAEYSGGRPGHPATRPAAGVRFDRDRPAVRDYARWLRARQDRLLEQVGRPAVLYRYTTALDGFAATLTTEQARRLRAAAGVVRVERSTKQRLDRVRAVPVVGAGTRDRLGLDGPRGVWARHGGPARAGHGVVVGVVDSGIWPANPGFDGLRASTPGTAPGLPGFHGSCMPAEEWSAEDCSDKVVSARWFVRGFGPENTAGAEYLSPRDGSGHGSHVASTAAGDHGVRVEVDGQRFGTTSGMAPAARLAIYKACWAAPDPSQDGCTTADTVAAVDAAVADGVDVLSYSISGSAVADDSVERAFLGAASAGVFVAASAGNDGPHAGTVRHVAPWVTTVAASTHHVFSGAVRLGDGRSFVGAMVAARSVPRSRLVLGGRAASPGSSVSAARHCAAGSLDAARVQGAIVVCDRGDGARADKSAAVADAGGAGMVLANTRPEDIEADVHAVPTVHLDAGSAAAVKRYLRSAGAGARATLDAAGRGPEPVPAVADFSSRGPVPGDVLKPDLTAPGVSVLGAVAPPSDSGRSWDLASGTSASAPGVAGLAAFVLGVHPGWSPARVKSAMMTTAYDVAGPHRPTDEGAGHVDPRRFLDPGLVLDTHPSAWRALVAGRVRARDVNAPSVAVGEMVGPTTLTRRVTNVSSRTEAYAVRVHGLRGVDVQAFPATLRLAPGASRTVRLRFTARPTATADRTVTGWLVLRGTRHRVRLPVSVSPTVVAAPEQVSAAGDAGRVVVRGRSGNGRTVKLHSTGLVAARTEPVTVRPHDPAAQRVHVPAGADLARFAAEAPAAGAGVSLAVYRGDTLVGRSTAASPQVTVPHPAAGDYRVVLDAPDAGGGADDPDAVPDPQPARLLTWVVPRRGGARVDLSTDAVGFAAGRRFRYSASWVGLDPAKHYLGVVGYGDSDRRTVVEVDPGTVTR